MAFSSAGNAATRLSRKACRRVGKVDAKSPGVVELVVDAAERRPLQPVVGQLGEQSPRKAVLRHLADCMHADVPPPLLATKGVGRSSAP